MVDWVARRVCQYLRELVEGARPWVLTGRVIDFGPDNEPLLDEVRPIAWLSGSLGRAMLKAGWRVPGRLVRGHVSGG